MFKEGREPIIPRLQEVEPERNIVFVAVDHLTDPNEMNQFLNEYTALLSESDDPKIKENPMKVATDNVNYVAGYYSRETAERWMAVTEVGHPLFGTAHLPYLLSNRGTE